jgi:GABA(A) receptor-associated protein
MSFKTNYSLYNRLIESKRVLEKYKDRIPIICEKSIKCGKDCPNIDKNKYLVPHDLTVGQFIYVIRKRMSLSAEKALYLIINGFIPSNSNYLSSLYNYYKEEDNFLYITYTFENTFG